MSDDSKTASRRQVITGLAIGFGSLGAGIRAFADPAKLAVQTVSGGQQNTTRMSLHQEIEIKASSKRVYDTLLSSKDFAALTTMSATIDRSEGGAFKTFGGIITGRNIELIPNKRIVQAWRPKNWDPGVYSIVHFELHAKGSETMLVLDHTGFPEGDYESLYNGWPERYWNPLKKFLS